MRLGNANIRVCFFFLVCFAAAAIPFQTQGAKIKCPLEWVPMSYDIPVPKSSVASDGVGLYVVRSTLANGAAVLGHADQKHAGGVAFLADVDNNRVETQLAYEVLTNPHGCTLTWVESTHADVPELTVSEGPTSSYYVGRAETTLKTLASGSVHRTSKELAIAEDDVVRKFTGTQYTVLLSFSSGLRLEISDFVFAQPPFGGSADMLGFDEISNMADTTVTQTVSHNKITEESFEMRISMSMAGYARMKVKVCVLLFICFPVWEKDEGDVHNEGSNSFVSSSRERDITVSRTIVVPPFAHVQACSVYYKQDNFSSAWDARVEFQAPGLTAGQVTQLLLQEPEWQHAELRELGNSVYTRINGSFSGTFVLASKFFVSDASGGGEGKGCGALRAIFERAKGAIRQSDVATPFSIGQDEIEKIINTKESARDCDPKEKEEAGGAY